MTFNSTLWYTSYDSGKILLSVTLDIIYSISNTETRNIHNDINVEPKLHERLSKERLQQHWHKKFPRDALLPESLASDNLDFT